MQFKVALRSWVSCLWISECWHLWKPTPQEHEHIGEMSLTRVKNQDLARSLRLIYE